MPYIKQRLGKPQQRRYNFHCRICKLKHGLQKCKEFQKMNPRTRLLAVVSNNYCVNCLAHHHSAGTCFSRRGCKYCGGSHHTLLHIKQKEPTRPQSLTQQVPKCISLASITSTHTTILFPTAIVLVQIGMQQYHARAIIDTCSSSSKISKRLLEDLNIPTTTLGDDEICRVTLRSRQPPHTILETTMKVNNRLFMTTPSQSINSSISRNFTNLSLADPEFYKSGTFSIVLGADMYSKIILTGMVPSTPGLPVAMNTIFGWVLSGSCSQ